MNQPAIVSYLPHVLAVTGYVLTLGFIPVILIRKKQPVSALAWCLAIIMLPFLGTILFLRIGVPKVNRRVRKKQFHRSRFIRQWIQTTSDQSHHPQPPSPVIAACEWEGLDRLAGIVGAVKTSVANRTVIYSEGTTAFDDKINAIEAATQHVHAEYYILQADQTGRRFVDCLCAKAREGVEVRLLVDALGSLYARKLLRRLRDAGGKADRFLPMLPSWRRILINFRNHRKLLICDGKVTFVGGLNIGDEYLSRSKRFGYWRDSQLKITGPAVLGAQRVFVEDWDFAHGEFLSGSKYFPKPATDGNDRLQIVWSGPDQDTNAIRETYFAAIMRASHRLWITTPYLVPDAAIISGLMTAARRGVDVRVLTQGSPPDSWLAYFAARYYWPDLLGSGVRIFMYGRGMMHAKVFLADGCFASTGSANMDIRSLSLNFEINCLIYSTSLIGLLEQQFQDDLSESVEVRSEDLGKKPIRVQLAENVSRLFSPIL